MSQPQQNSLDSTGKPITDERVNAFMGNALSVFSILRTMGGLLNPCYKDGRIFTLSDDDITGLACLFTMLSEQLSDIQEIL